MPGSKGPPRSSLLSTFKIGPLLIALWRGCLPCILPIYISSRRRQEKWDRVLEVRLMLEENIKLNIKTRCRHGLSLEGQNDSDQP